MNFYIFALLPRCTPPSASASPFSTRHHVNPRRPPVNDYEIVSEPMAAGFDESDPLVSSEHQDGGGPLHPYDASCRYICWWSVVLVSKGHGSAETLPLDGRCLSMEWSSRCPPHQQTSLNLSMITYLKLRAWKGKVSTSSAEAEYWYPSDYM
ncbi:hypothetical protein B0H15DRAFT_821978 [Mycena belliarum]|uniref:Uncharacterized protein n=1 Tax=Mycena belliarum TaxID=1033014 RepID=A0AAD6UFN6_9AGAR|nr:hypothetical protein B0H15DRAFT_821978 [Mycena belliae]